MTDDAYDAQTLATSARIERLHFLRFGSQRRTWTCERGHVNRNRLTNACFEFGCLRRRPWNATAPVRQGFPLYGLSDTETHIVDTEALIFSRAN